MPFDLVLRGGRVIDPTQKLDAVADVAFAAGKVVMVGNALKADPGTAVRYEWGNIGTPGVHDLDAQRHRGAGGPVPVATALGVAELVGMALVAHIDHPTPSYEDRDEASLHQGASVGGAGAGTRGRP